MGFVFTLFGQVEVESEHRKGTTIRLWFPIYEKEVQE
jgi:signal transduction histidine kinase